MAEEIWTTVTIGGRINRDVSDELHELLEGMFEFVEDEPHGRLVASGIRNYGNADETEEFCRKHDLAYVLHWCAHSGVCGAGIHTWRPGMEAAVAMDANDDQYPVISLPELKRGLAQNKPIAEIIAGIEIGDASNLPRYEVFDDEPVDG